jgi:hypothetical protein
MCRDYPAPYLPWLPWAEQTKRIFYICVSLPKVAKVSRLLGFYEQGLLVSLTLYLLNNNFQF